jgi:hypothetical protein
MYNNILLLNHKEAKFKVGHIVICYQLRFTAVFDMLLKLIVQQQVLL